MPIRNTKLDRIISNIDRQVLERDADRVIEEMYNGMSIIVDELKSLKKQNNELTRRLNELTRDE